MRQRMISEVLKERYGTKVYRLALSSGATCPNRDGTCALCGCFVELRAQKKRAVCPHVPGKWPANRPKADLP